MQIANFKLPTEGRQNGSAKPGNWRKAKRKRGV
jgi:hypothetical protein